MDRAELVERLKRVVVDALELGIRPENVPADLDLGDRGGVAIDSIEAVALVLALEHEFEVRFGEEDLDMTNFYTLGSMADLVERKLAEQGEK